MEIAVSVDGTNFKQIRRFEELVEIQSTPKIKDYVAELPAQSVQYVRVKAVNVGICPEWHPGNGGKAWLFVDEIIVE